jgi:hypothetical protein
MGRKAEARGAGAAEEAAARGKLKLGGNAWMSLELGKVRKKFGRRREGEPDSVRKRSGEGSRVVVGSVDSRKAVMRHSSYV